MTWDETYSGTAAYFGEEAEPLVREHLPATGRLRILDVGAGQGRNTIPLARGAHRVTAIDPSRVAMAQVAERAARERLDVTTWVGGFAEFPPPPRPFDAVLVLGLVPILERGALETLRTRLHEWTTVGGWILLTAFTVADPAYARCAAEWREVGRRSYADEAGSVRTFLEPGEVLELFREYDVVHHREGLGPEHRHADGPVHRHGLVELVAVHRVAP